MLALCLMLLGTYYAQNYAGIIGRSVPVAMIDSLIDIASCQYVCFAREN